MSLAPQRPNYVLIWIGIVMLTFSMAGNRILDSNASTTSNLAGSTRFSMDYEDSAILPETSAQHRNSFAADALAAEDAFDQMVPLRQDESPVDGISLANQDPIDGPSGWQPFPMETVGVTKASSEDSEQKGLALGIAPEELISGQPEQQFHALGVKQGLTRKQKAAARWSQGDQYNSGWNGNDNFSRTGKKGKGRNGRSISVKSTFTPKGNGRIAVRFFLGQAGHLNSFQNRLALLQDQESERLARLAEGYLEALEEVLSEDQDDDHDSNLDSENRNRLELQRLAQMKSNLREHLMQRPGGIELVAELNPSQLEALLQKLSAQNPKFRALVSS